MVHVGRTGSFVPVKDNGALLWRIKDDKRYAVTGTKGYKWIEREMAIHRGITISNWHDMVDVGYFEDLAEDAMNAINEYGNFDEFVS